MLRLSRDLALGFGVLLPIAETIRRWDEIVELRDVPYWIDDYLLGAFLVLAGFRVWKRGEGGRAQLAAAWGASTGVLALSTLGQWEALRAGDLDPAPIPSGLVLGIKILALLLCVVGMTLCFGKPESEPGT